MSMRHPVSLAARRAFCPSAPMALERSFSETMTRAVRSSGSRYTFSGRAGDRALATKVSGSGSQATTSTFSWRSSLLTCCTRAARGPTQAPTGSTLRSVDQTATLERWPGSRAQALISTTPSCTSGTSSSKSRLSSPGCVRDSTTWGPLVVRRTSAT